MNLKTDQIICSFALIFDTVAIHRSGQITIARPTSIFIIVGNSSWSVPTFFASLTVYSLSVVLRYDNDSWLASAMFL